MRGRGCEWMCGLRAGQQQEKFRQVTSLFVPRERKQTAPRTQRVQTSAFINRSGPLRPGSVSVSP